MQKGLSLIFSLGCCTLSNLLLSDSLTAQGINSDGTTNTQVNSDGNGNFTIEQGDRAGDNLFHSFDRFSVPTNGSAAFNNATDITNIFNRVTGGNISNIDGLIEANGSANLFLVNPAGIVFGNNAKLDIGGSFLGTTADSILFEDGTFSAVDLDNPPLLTINAPIGLNFRDNPESINNSAGFQELDNAEVVEESGLAVDEGKSIALVGGDINLDNGRLTAPGGRIELGGLSQAGTIQLNPDLSLNFVAGTTRADVFLTGVAELDVTSGGGGDINVFVRNLDIRGGSDICAGIGADGSCGSRNENFGSVDAQAGNITLDALETITVVNSKIHNVVNNQAVGNSGDIVIRASQVEVLETLNADVDVDSGNFLNNGIFSSVNLEGTGNAGNISIESQRLNISGNGARISAATLGEGNAGNITIQTEQLSVSNGSQIGTTNFGIGNAGVLLINASESIDVSGRGDFPSGLFSNISEESENGNVSSFISIEAKNLSVSDNGRLSASSFGTGEGGDLTINVEKLIVENGGQVQAVAFSDGSAGDLTINASESIELKGVTEEVRTGLFSSAIDNNENGGSGDGGNLTIFTDKLIIEDGATAGVSNFQSLNLVPPGKGAAGNLEINANLIELNNGTISAANANGIGGGLKINANSMDIDNGSSINAFTTSDTGQGGIINLSLENNLVLRNNSEISAQAFNDADGGNLTIDTDFIIAFPGNNDIIANAQQGEGGVVNINAESLLGITARPLSDRTNDINASSENSSLDGDVVINTSDINPIRGTTELPSNPVDVDRTIVQACRNDRNTATANSFVVKGRGGVPSAPIAPLSSDSITANGEFVSNQNSDRPIMTAQGEIIPARGVVKTEDGRILLTATASEKRSPAGMLNCNGV